MMFFLRVSIAIAMTLLSASIAFAAENGTLKLDVLGDIGAGAENAAQIIGGDGKVVAEVHPGASVAIKPGDYILVLPIIGGKITKSDIRIESGRTRTVMIDSAAVMEVHAKDRNGKDPGFGVTVTSSSPPHGKVTSFITGEKFSRADAG